MAHYTMRIVTLLARHSTQKYADAVENIDTWFSHQLPVVEHDLVVVDSALTEDHQEQLAAGRVLLGSSNAHWEFSAWDRAIGYLGHRIEDYDLVHLATSAFGALDVHHLARFDADMLDLMVGRRFAVGNIDYFNEPIVLQGRSSQAWLRSSWIFMPPRELLRLGSLVSIADGSPLFSGDPDAPFRDDAPLSDNFRRYIVGYLTGTRPEMTWHSYFPLSVDTLPYFQAKTIAILNEHMLSIRLRLQGSALVDATWLATRQVLAPHESSMLIPDWHWQVAARDLVRQHAPATHVPRLSAAVRATLVVGETWAVARSHGSAAARSILWDAVVRDPRLIIERPVLGAVRRCMLPAGTARSHI